MRSPLSDGRGGPRTCSPQAASASPSRPPLPHRRAGAPRLHRGLLPTPPPRTSASRPRSPASASPTRPLATAAELPLEPWSSDPPAYGAGNHGGRGGGGRRGGGGGAPPDGGWAAGERMRPQLEHLYSLLTCGPRTFTGSFSVALSAPPHLGVRKCELEHFTFPSGALRSMASTALVGVGGGLSLRLAAASSCSSTAASFYRRAGGGSRRHGRRLVLLHRGSAWVSVSSPVPFF